jgi:formylglycine-generating enzyme required for sulfatase activity
MSDNELQSELQWLMAEVNHPATTHGTRAEVGERLAEIGDPRPGVGLAPNGLPFFAWLPVKGGEVQLDASGPAFQVEEFYVSRYLTTYQQFQVFLEADDGYVDPIWWQDLPGRDEDPPQQGNPLDNHPAESLSWVDAVAFCRWYVHQIQQLSDEEVGNDSLLRLVREAGWEIRLPTEWEWQQAATGGHPSYVYPWGTEPDDARANTAESDLGRTVAVGMYPMGAAPSGALDMSGNVWEWCLNAYEEPSLIDVSTDVRRPLRGGSWFHYMNSARTSSRESFTPMHRFNLLGFRVVCSRPPSPFRVGSAYSEETTIVS